MSVLENINFSFSANPLILISGVLLAALFSYYFYRVTIPPVSKTLKYFLYTIRVIALSLIIFLLFEPILTLEYLETRQSKSLIFIDNSKSITVEDSTARSDKINYLIEGIEESLGGNAEYFTFGSSVTEVSADDINEITHSENATNFSLIIDQVESAADLADAVLIISDGIITEGANPVYRAEKLGVPIFTAGIGDSSIKKDASVNKILSNEYIYAEQNTLVRAEILHPGFSGEPVTAEFKENGKSLAQKNIVLSNAGITRVEFDYTPDSKGEKMITVELSKLQDEANTNNNFKNKYINVLDKKVNVLLVSSSPSSDLSIVKNILIENENYNVESIVQISSTEFLSNKFEPTKVDSADVLVLIGFPSKDSAPQFENKIKNSINDHKPFLMILSNGTELKKLNSFSNELPVLLSNISSNYIQVQPSITDLNSSLLRSNSAEYISLWNNLPPVNLPRFNAQLKAGSNVISKSNFKGAIANIPLIVSRAVGKSRSVMILANSIWKWRLNANDAKNNVFNDFIHNSIEWLNVDSENPQLIVNTTKREYSYGETVEFSAQVYDENFNPVNSADLNITANNNGSEYNINLTSIDNGIYEGSLEVTDIGIYDFTGSAKIGNKTLGKVKGKFNISASEIEKLNLVMDTAMLKLLANTTDGKYFDVSEADLLAAELKKYSGNNIIENSSFKEFNLWSDIRILIFIVLLFGLEWFLRKKAGML
ncbi:MAG: hypothetical protein HND52_01985 [Ignavibacteriae bacterium]|nr:hypothetical protein [Ignavibacteriota bacterium]NOG96721.1 hypothetical protein [Ignavibacteriota bacterium]